MTNKEALQLLSKIAANQKLTREEHLIIDKAVHLLNELVKKSEVEALVEKVSS